MSQANTLRPSSLFNDFRLLLILFIGFRVLAMLTYQPILNNGIEQGIGTGGDRQYHFSLSQLTDQDLYPFSDWWSEFPPIWYLITTSTYQLMGENANYSSWSLLLGMLMITSEVGILVLMRNIGTSLRGAEMGMALAWIYALMFAPFAFMWWNFDSLMTFFLLLGVWYLIRQQETRAAIALAIGILVKFVPALVFGAMIRFRDTQTALRTIAISLGVVVLVYLPFFASNAELTAVSVTAQFGKASYQTVWAIVDGNYGTGNFGSVESHLTAEGVNEVGKNPARIPSWLRLGIAGAIGLFVFLRTRRFDNIGLVAFVGITLVIFYLQSQGWSPQWLTQIIPLTLLVFPTREGVLVTVLLSLMAFVEYPFLFIRTGDTGGVISGSLFMPWVIVVVGRTILLISLAVAFYQKLRQEPIPE